MIAVFYRLRARKAAVLGVSFLLGIPLLLAVNGTLSGMIGEPPVDIWDILSVFILLVAGKGFLRSVEGGEYYG